MSIRSITVFSVLRRNACLFHDKIAIEKDDYKITFGQLLEKVEALGSGLRAQGIGKGDIIAVLSKNSEPFLLLYCAAAYIGAIIVPINWRLSVDEIRYIVSDCNPKMIFVESEIEGLINQRTANGLPSENILLLDRQDGGMPSFESLMDMGISPVEEEVNGSDPYILSYTAAIEGSPRGALLSQDNLVSCNVQTALQMGLTMDDAHLNILPIFHMIGLSVAMSVMHVGGRNVVMSKFDPQSVLNVIDEKDITIVGTFPPILSKLLGELTLKDYDISSLKHVYGIENTSIITDFEKRSRSQFWCLYGQTESMLSCLSPSVERIGSAGRPGVLVDLVIADEDGNQLLPGETGEILIRGPMVFLGYWNQKELSEYIFRNGWHHTGDIGHLDEDGYLWFKGRKEEKELIKSGGENVYPVEVEKVLLEHPSVKEVVVFGVPDEEYGEGIKAVVVLNEFSKLSKKELVNFVAGKIARYKRPRYIEFVGSLPKTDDGSIDRKLVKAEFSTQN